MLAGINSNVYKVDFLTISLQQLNSIIIETQNEIVFCLTWCSLQQRLSAMRWLGKVARLRF